jgi:hypothetical protein
MISAALGDLTAAMGLREISVVPLQGARPLPDSSSTYVLRSGTHQWVLKVSSRVAPGMVKRACDRQRLVRARLSEPAAEAIELPLIEGEIDGLTYALWPRRTPLSENRYLRRLQTMSMSPRILRWLSDVASQTVEKVEGRVLAERVGHLLSVDALPQEIKDLAKRAAEEFSADRIQAATVAQHDDLWPGNVLKAGNSLGFIVIDWAGGRLDGAPYYDLVKWASWCRFSPKATRDALKTYGEKIGLPAATALPHTLAGLGFLHTHLEYFPEHRFVELCKRSVDTITNATPLSGK